MKTEQRILIVDDDDAIRALVETVLRRRGFRIETARNGVDAMERMNACRFALVVLDLMMPRMSGYEVLEHLGKLPLLSRPLVLVLTAGVEPRPIAAEMVVGTIHKPFDIELLVDIVRGCLSSRAAEAQVEECPPVATEMPEQPPN